MTALPHPSRTRAAHAKTTEAPAGRSFLRSSAAYLPSLALAALVLASLVRTGVGGGDIVRYGLYWIVAVILPGKVVARALIGVRRTVVEDLALAAITGVCLEVLAWVVGVVTGIGSIARFWWVPVLVAGLVVPFLRRRTLTRVPDRMGFTQATGLAVVVWLVVMQLDLTGFRLAPVPPRAGGIFGDVWWHLSLVQEMMKYERPQTPQVTGIPFHYHYFANVQMASGARLSGVAPEDILLRLWPVAAILLCVGLGFTLVRVLTRSVTAGVVGAGLMFAVTASGYLWPNIGSFAPSLFLFHSPSEVLANSGVVVSVLAIVMLLRDGVSVRLVVWSLIVVVGSSGDKSTVVPVVAAGTVVALVRAAFTRSRAALRTLVAATVVLVVLGLVILKFAAGTQGGTVVLFGTLRVIPSFKDLVPTSPLLGVNDGLVLDSIDSPRAVGIAILVCLVLLGVHGVRLVGLASLARKQLRADLAVWLLAGSVVAGYVATFCFDQIGLSQVFFAATAAPLGAALTVHLLHDSVSRSAGNTRLQLLVGPVLGCGTALIIREAVDVRESSADYHDLERMLLPPVVAVAVAVIAVVVWSVWRLRRGTTRGGVWVVVVTAALGLAIPTVVQTTWTNVHSWVRSVHYRDFSTAEHLSGKDLTAMLWLRKHSAADDVVMTNTHCVPVTARPRPLCAARAFWVSGLSGRRVVLEGWAYTDKAQALQGVGGRTYANQPSPFARRFQLNEAVFDENDVTALEKLRQQFGVRWIVSVHSSGPTPKLPSDIARVRFDNGAVTIFQVAR